MASPPDQADVMATALVQVIHEVLRGSCVRHQLASYLRDELDLAKQEAVSEIRQYDE